jgi:hypothetical protein
MIDHFEDLIILFLLVVAAFSLAPPGFPAALGLQWADRASFRMQNTARAKLLNLLTWPETGNQQMRRATDEAGHSDLESSRFDEFLRMGGKRWDDHLD